MVFSMRCPSSALTLAVPLMKAETVAIETPAACATSIIVGALDFLVLRTVLSILPKRFDDLLARLVRYFRDGCNGMGRSHRSILQATSVFMRHPPNVSLTPSKRLD